jgi:hypothetical protein
MDHLLEEYEMVLENLVLEGIKSPELHELMNQAELYLDKIQIDYGPKVYDLLNQCYINTLEEIGVIDYFDNTKNKKREE